MYLLCNDQFIVGAGGPIAINFVAVGYVLDNWSLGEADKLDTLERVKGIATEVIGKLYEGSNHGKTST